jgi:hypothetical protein
MAVCSHHFAFTAELGAQGYAYGPCSTRYQNDFFAHIADPQ